MPLPNQILQDVIDDEQQALRVRLLQHAPTSAVVRSMMRRGAHNGAILSRIRRWRPDDPLTAETIRVYRAKLRAADPTVITSTQASR